MQDSLSTMRPTPNAQRPTPNAQRPTPNAQRPTYDSVQNQDDTIHVVLLVYDPSGTYSPHAGVVMTSLFEHTSSKITVHIIHDETLTDENRRRLIRTAEKYSQTIAFEDVSAFKQNFTDKAVDLARRKCTIGSLYRFFVPELLADIHKVIYLDCDIVVNLDVSEMWNIDVENYCLAGVHSKGFETFSEAVRDRLNGSSNMTFINAGVMIMNLDMMRAHGNLFRDAMAWIERRVHLMNFSDQDVINNLFYGSIKLIDAKYNNFNPTEENQLPDSIIHTPHPVYAFKTWGMRGLPSQRLYWKYYMRSAWGEGKSTDDIIGLLSDSVVRSLESTEQKYRPSVWQRIKRIMLRILRKIFCVNTEPVIAMRYIVKDAYYRIRQRFSR